MLNSNEVLAGNFASKRRWQTASNPNGVHNGIDFPVVRGTQVKSRYDGVVEVVGTNPPGEDFGNYIRVFHPALNQSTWYAHLRNATVSVGQPVKAGQEIGFSGNTGYVLPKPTPTQPANGSHLHFSHSKGRTTQWLDPDLQPNQQIGGEDMTNVNNVWWLYRDILGRPNGSTGDSGASGYVGKPWATVYDDLYNSAEAKAYRTRLVQNDNLVKTIPALQGQINDARAQLKAVKAHLDIVTSDDAEDKAAIAEANKQIAELQKKLAEKPTGPSNPQEQQAVGLLSSFINWLRGLIGGGR